MVDEQQKQPAGSGIADKQLTDKELEAILRKSDKITEFPEVTFDEFTVPTTDEWIAACNVLLKGQPFDKVMYTKNYEGITFEPIYTLKATEEILPADNYPGMGDFLRGNTVNEYVQEPWGVAQSCDESMPADNNELLKDEVEKGSTVYNVRLDTATMTGIDVRSADKPGDTGVNITTIEDMNSLLRDLNFAKYPFMMYTGQSAVAMLSMVAATLQASGKNVNEVHGVIGSNPLGELIKNGKNTLPLSALYDDMAACITWTRKNAPELRTVFVDSEVFTDGGAEAVQEVAYTFAIAVEYIRKMQEKGISIHDIANSLYFCFNQGANFFMEIAKLRALKEVWANIMTAFGADEKDRAVIIHGRPAKFTKTVFDPYVNMLRNTTQTFSSVVGGVNTYENAPFDQLIRKGDVFSRRIARNLHVMLQEEFGMLRPIDAAGGSWAVESLTKQIAEKIWAEFQKIEEMGGITKALSDGYPQRSIDEVLQKRFKSLDLRKDRAVGVNMYPNMTEELLDTRPEDTAMVKKERIAAVEAYRSDVDVKFLEEKLKGLKTTGLEIENAIAAFSAGATIGEFEKAYHTEASSEQVVAILAHHWTERFEALRRDTVNYKAKTNKNIEVFLANMGPIPQHKARAEFSTSFLEVGEFHVHLNDGFQDGEDGSAVDKCIAALKAEPYDVAVICSTDKTYPEIVPALAPKLKEALPNGTIFLAGAAPKEMVEIYKAAGVDDFISVSANCYDILRMLQKKKGMIE